MACVGGFSLPGVAAILVTQTHAQVMPPCDCVANSVRLAVEYREIVATGVNFGLMALSEISAR